MIPLEDVKLGLKCCLDGSCKFCPFAPIPDPDQCRVSLLDNTLEQLQAIDEVRRERDDLAERVYELEEMVEGLEEQED